MRVASWWQLAVGRSLLPRVMVLRSRRILAGNGKLILPSFSFLVMVSDPDEARLSESPDCHWVEVLFSSCFHSLHFHCSLKRLLWWTVEVLHISNCIKGEVKNLKEHQMAKVTASKLACQHTFKCGINKCEDLERETFLLPSPVSFPISKQMKMWYNCKWSFGNGRSRRFIHF